MNGYITDAIRYRLGYTYVKAELEEDFVSAQSGDVIAPRAQPCQAPRERGQFLR